MSILVERIKEVVARIPIMVKGKKLGKTAAENKIWSFLSDSRIGIMKSDPDTHVLMDPEFITERDFRTVFCDEGEMALSSVRALMKALLVQEKAETLEVEEKSPGLVESVVNLLASQKPIGQYSTKELLERYDADSPQETWDELFRRGRGKPCIVFKGKGEVDVKISLAILKSIRKGQFWETTYNDGTKSYRVYPVGVFPEESALCCPLTGKILNNGFCSSLGISWNGVDEQTLVFIRVIRDENSGEQFGKFIAKSLLRTAKEGMESLRSEYSAEALVYDEMKDLNQLPSLRVSLNSLAKGRRIGRRTDPFGTPRRD